MTNRQIDSLVIFMYRLLCIKVCIGRRQLVVHLCRYDILFSCLLLYEDDYRDDNSVIAIVEYLCGIEKWTADGD